MKVLCDVCEMAAAAVVCCADEAALCWNCDEKVHAANKLAGKHQRVPLLFSSSNSDLSSSNSPLRIPTCDICQVGLSLNILLIAILKRSRNFVLLRKKMVLGLFYWSLYVHIVQKLFATVMINGYSSCLSCRVLSSLASANLVVFIAYFLV